MGSIETCFIFKFEHSLKARSPITHMTNRSKLQLAGMIAVVFCLAYLIFGDTAVSRAYHVHLANKHLPTIKAAIDGIPELNSARLKFKVVPEYQGSIEITGTMGDDSHGWEKLGRLRTVISNTQPNFNIHYFVTFGSKATWVGTDEF
jgi:hypothetical protein